MPDFIKKKEDVQKDVERIVKYLNVSDRKHRGPARPMLRTATEKYELHEVLVSIVDKLESLEKKISKKPGRPKKDA
jgi:hypothetical protein